jgi:hypothetical protein
MSARRLSISERAKRFADSPGLNAQSSRTARHSGHEWDFSLTGKLRGVNACAPSMHRDPHDA